MNINQYLYAHNGGGVAIGDINQDGLPDIYFTANQQPNKLYLNKGNFVFEDITEKAHVEGLSGTSSWKTGVVMVDINHDGWLDIYVSQMSNYKSFTGRNQLYINNGDLTFTDKAKDYHLDFESYSQQAAFFDYDLDGDLDMFQLNHSVRNPEAYGKSVLRYKRDSLAGDRLLRNVDGVFEDVSERSGIRDGVIGYGLAVSVADIDNNGCPDIFVSNDFHENDYVYYNNCDGTFREDIQGTLTHTSAFSMGNDIADINNDGWLDIISVDMKPEDEILRKQSAGTDPLDIFNYKLSYGYYYQYPRNMLQLNRGKLFGQDVQFSEIGQLAGVEATDWSWSALLLDLDNDGWKDIYITNGIWRRPIDLDYVNFTYNEEASRNMSTLEKAYKMPGGSAKNYAYRNSSDLKFTNVSSEWGLDRDGYSMGASYADLDLDGDLDLVVNNLNSEASIHRNNAESIAGNNFIKIKLSGTGKNTFGIGAVVEVYVENETITQVVNPTRGWLSSVDYALTFGVGKSKTINSVTVKWPDGTVQVVEKPEVNAMLEVFQKHAAKKSLPRVEVAKKLFENVTLSSGISFTHRENTYSDINQEPLIPHQLSSEGPALAVGDLDKDGLDDFYVGGAAGQSGELFYQKSGDSTYFEKWPGLAFEDDKEQEDTDAMFFDCDKDGDLDLYVVSGGGQDRYPDQAQDRLYINKGSGDFERSNGLPNLTRNGSCMVAADFNGDGFDDIFQGTRSIVQKYGVSPDSYLLWNDGKGQYSVDTTAYSQVLRSLGMVTDVAWLPAAKELVVVGEWMPVTFLEFKKAAIEKREIPNTGGWWNTIHVSDLDNDGDDDLLAGNCGLNTNLRASVQQPVRLYVKDFDNNFMTEPLITYYRQDKEWLYAGLDEVKKQLPSIRSRFPSYTSFARSTFPEIFHAEAIASAIKKEVQLFQSVYLMNEGKSKYTVNELPIDVQFSPVYAFVTGDFNGDGIIDILTAGNFNGSTPSIGRLGASYGNCLLGSAGDGYEVVQPLRSGFSVFGEVRNMKILKSPMIDMILVCRNNSTTRLFMPVRSDPNPK